MKPYKKQSQPLRIENPDNWSFATSRTIRSELWFVNNKKLIEHTLNFLARYQERHSVEIYAFCIMGNHHHVEARFPRMNRALFFRDLNARIAEGVRFFAPGFESGPVMQRRFSEQAIVDHADLEDYFFYCALQPVKAGLCEKISEYPGYNSFDDAISGRKLKRKYVNWDRFNAAKRKDPTAHIKDYTTIHTLEYKRLPGYEHLSQKEYRHLMLKKLEERRQELIRERKEKGLGFLGREALLEVVPGTRPKHTKKSTRNSKRPLVLTKCPEAKKRFLDWYFSVYDAYKTAARWFMKGKIDVPFPPGTYRPPLCMVAG